MVFIQEHVTWRFLILILGYMYMSSKFQNSTTWASAWLCGDR